MKVSLSQLNLSGIAQEQFAKDPSVFGVEKIIYDQNDIGHLELDRFRRVTGLHNFPKGRTSGHDDGYVFYHSPHDGLQREVKDALWSTANYFDYHADRVQFVNLTVIERNPLIATLNKVGWVHLKKYDQFMAQPFCVALANSLVK